MIETDHEKIIKNMKKKGWEKHYLSKTHNILKNSENKKHPRIKKLDKILFFINIPFIILLDIVILIGVLPLLILMPDWFFILTLSIIGLAAGTFVDYILRNINLSQSQYVFSITIITAAVLLTFIWIIQELNPLLLDLGYIIHINPLLILLFYKLIYFIPHMIYKVKK